MAGRDGSRPSLLSRLLKPRSAAESRRTQSATAAMLKGGASLEAPLLEPTPSSSADADVVMCGGGEGGGAADLQQSLSYESSGSSSGGGNQLCGGSPGRSRLGQQGTKSLSWSMDSAILRALQVQEAVDRQLLQQQQAADGTDQPGAECFIVTTSPSSFQPGNKALAMMIKAQGGAVPATPPHVGMPQAGTSSLQQQQQQGTPPVPTVAVAVHELAAAFERRCAAAAAAGGAAPTSPKRQPSVQSPGLVSPSTGSLRSPQQGAGAAGNSSRSTAGSPAAKPTSPFCTLDGQSTAKAAWQQWATAAEGPAQQQQAPLPAASSLGIPQSMQSYLQQQLQQQHSAPGGGGAATDAASGLATQDSLASTGSSSSRSSSSPFKPRPPAAGAASPQRSRPGTALRQSGSAPLPPAPSAAAAPPPPAVASPGTPAVAGTAAAGTAAATAAPLLPLTPHKPNNALTAAAASPEGARSPAGIVAALAARAAAAASATASPVKAAAPKPPLPVAPASGTAAAGAGATAAALVDPQAAQQAAQQAMMQQMQQGQQAGSPRLGPQQQQLCAPIAIARHCPRDLQSTSCRADFVQTKKLYEGKIAAVVQGYHAASGRPLALKVYNRARLDTMERFQLAREVCLHMRSCHPAITTLYAAYKDARYIYLLMELAPSGNLYQMLMAMPVAPGRPRCLPERDAVGRVIKPLLSALAYLHDQGIIHRDIKLENVLLTGDGSIKLADFGLSIDTRHEPANTRLGTQGYFAPEVLALPLKSSPFEGKSPEEAASRPGYDCKVDVWSAGVVCFEVLTGRAPFAAENVAQVLQAILHRQLVYPGHLSPEAVSFLSTALTRDPKTRPTVRQLLQHPFIATLGQPAAS